MSKKNLGKHGLTTSQSKARTLHAMSIGAAGALVGASLALGVTPGGTPLAHADATPTTPTPATTQPQAQPQKQDAPKAGEAKAGAANGAKKAPEQGAKKETKVQSASTAQAKSPVPVTNLIVKAGEGDNAKAQDREATPNPSPQAGPQANPEITLSKETKDTLPNMYAWGSTDNVYIENGQNTSVKITLKPADGIAVTKVAIFPNDNIDINGRNAKDFVEYKTGDDNAHQPYSGEYGLATNQDGSATLTVNKLYRNNNMAATGYAANRCIYVYGTKDGQEVLLYKTNIARAATLIPPKTTGSIVLKYNEELTDKQIREKLQKALDAPTAGKDGKSLRDQIADASQARGVGVRDKVNEKKLDNTPDDPEKKILVTDSHAYNPDQVKSINTPTAKQGETVTAYQTGVVKLKTFLVSDLGYKSDVLPLTIARYDTRIDKPTVEDPDNVSQEVKADIKKKLARLNHVPEDKVTIGADGKFTISFDGVDAQDAPKIALRDLVLKKLEEKDISVPAADKAVIVANPLGYSKAELDRIKTAIFDANKDKKELGLTSKDQITLEYIKGDIVNSGHANQGISNGQAENKITVKIKTDKSVAEFTSNVKENKLTKLPDIRKDYDVSWDKTKIDGRDTDEGISWSNDSKTTIIYRYDPTKAEEFDTTKILGLLKATPKDRQAGLRDLTGGEALDHEDTNGKPRKSHMKYALKDDEPTGELSLGNMSGAYWIGNQKVSHSDEKLGDNLSEAGSYSWDTEAGPVKVAGKKGKIYKARLFVQPYAMSYYKDVYLEQGRNPGNTAKAINIIFVPQTNHKTKDLSDSIGEHKTENVEGKDVPTQSKYYNASGDKKEAYDKALQTAKTLYDSVKDTDESKLTEEQKAQIDNATITLKKARAELDGPDTNKDGLNASIEANGKAAAGSTAATPGTVTTDKYKNVTEPDFKKADGSADTERNEAAKKAKTDYDNALAEANKVKEDKNATQKAVDAAKAKLDAARAKLNDFTTNKEKLNAAIAEHGQVKNGKTGSSTDITKADPAYQNANDDERKAYDEAVKKANELSKDPNASQKEVNAAIEALEAAKKALDAKATDKSQLITAEKLTFDNPDKDDASKQSTFYKNALNKQTNGANEQEKQAAKDAVDNYNNALQKAREVIADKNATQAQVDAAKDALTKAEDALHKDYASDPNELTKVLADNFSGYLMPAYFNAFDKAQAGDEDAKKAFKDYNDAYQKAKELKRKLEEAKNGGTAPTQDKINEAKKALEEARKVIDKYATNTSRLSAAALNDIAIQNSPAYKNVSADDASADAKAAKTKYDEAVKKLHQALNKQMPKDKQGNTEIPTSNTPDANIDVNNANALDNIQAHAQGEPLDRDITKILKEMNDAIADLNKFATKTDDLLKSVNEDAATHQNPAFKNASHPDYKNESGQADTDKNGKASKAVDDYGKALNEAKELLKNPAATQKEVNDALKKLDNARKELDKYNTDTTKLAESVKKHGSTEGPAPTEGTQTSDAYRNASDPHFLTPDGKPDEQKNKQAAEDKKAYDEALTKAQELLKKHDDKDTPQDAKPIQKEIDAALKALDDARKKLEDNYKTVTTDLETEINKSTPEGAPAVTDNDFENTPEFKNADAKKKDGADGNKVDNDDVKAYKDALAKARKLAQANTSKTLSDRPTQKQINDALEALKQAKQAITDGYKTDVEKLKQAKQYAEDVFKNTPEYKNATAIKDDTNNAKHEQAGKDLGDATKQTGFEGQIAKIAEKLKDTSKLTQREVDALVKQLNIAQKKIADDYKTDVKPLSNEVGDKDEHGKDVIPPFEASVPYKNALAKKDAESEEDAKKDTSATKKLEAYNKALTDAQELIAKHNDANTPQDAKPTQKQVDDALNALKEAKKAITDNFKTNAKDLKKETKELKDDGQPKDEKDQFEKSTEYQNALAKTDADSKKDVQTYKAALEKANKLLELFNDDGTPKADIPAGTQIPTQQEVDEAQKALEEIKAKIFANYKTNPKDLNDEVLQSQPDVEKVDPKDVNPNAFEVTPAFRNAQEKVKQGDHAADAKIKAYQKKLDDAKKLLDKFDPKTGKPKTDLPAGEKAPTQKQLDDALKALQDAKAAIIKYDTTAQALRDAVNSDFTSTQPYQNVLASWGAADISKNPYVAKYLEALNAAKAVLDRHYGNYDEAYKPTQKEVNEALAKLKLAEKELSDAYNEPHAFLDPQTYGNTPSGGGAGGAGGAVGANTGEAGNAGAHDANKPNEGAHANHDANHNTNTNVHQPQHAAHNNTNANTNANAGANANVAADALGTGAAQAPDGSKASKDTNSNNARLPKTSDALPLYANSAAVLVAIAVLTRTNRRRKKNRL